MLNSNWAVAWETFQHLIYLYVGLGMAMLTAIMAMFEMASGITNSQIFSRPPVDPYMQLGSQAADLQFLALIGAADSSWRSGDANSSWRSGDANSSWRSGDALCTKIEEEINKFPKIYPDLAGYTRTQATSSNHLRLAGSCVLVKGQHRVLVTPRAGVGSFYGLYSCALQKGNPLSCTFEAPRR